MLNYVRMGWESSHLQYNVSVPRIRLGTTTPLTFSRLNFIQ